MEIPQTFLPQSISFGEGGEKAAPKWGVQRGVVCDIFGLQGEGSLWPHARGVQGAGVFVTATWVPGAGGGIVVRAARRAAGRDEGGAGAAALTAAADRGRPRPLPPHRRAAPPGVCGGGGGSPTVRAVEGRLRASLVAVAADASKPAARFACRLPAWTRR